MAEPVAIEATAQGPALISGLDSLYVSFFLDMSNGGLDFEDLASRKEFIRIGGNPVGKVELGSEAFVLMPYGRKPYTCVLVNRAFEVRLGPNVQPACHVQFFSEALWKFGLDGLEQRFRAWCKSLGLGNYRRETVARSD